MNDVSAPLSDGSPLVPPDTAAPNLELSVLPATVQHELEALMDAWQDLHRSRSVIMFTDIEGSVQMQERLGTRKYATLLKRHDEFFTQSVQTVGGNTMLKHTGDGFLALFRTAADAVHTALRFQWLLNHEPWPAGGRITARIGIGEGEILVMPQRTGGAGMVGSDVNRAARVMSLAGGRQILVTRSVFDTARQIVQSVPGVTEPQVELGWEAHGPYLVKGIDTPIEVFEIGVRGQALFAKPPDTSERQRSVAAEDEATLGWRPAVGLAVPQRTGWTLTRKLGEGGFGEVWLANNAETEEQRVFKFCFDALRLRSFKRELALFRLIRHNLGARPDMASLFEVRLDEPPYFLESEYCSGGMLSDWLEARSQNRQPVPLPERLEIMVRVTRALAAAHSLGIIHKDVKPSNIFMEIDAAGHALPKLADFGIGVVVDDDALMRLGIGRSEVQAATLDLSRTGTRMYAAPEYMSGAQASIQGDIFSLGVLLYQLVISDFNKPLSDGWRRDVPDPLLADDIARCVDGDATRRFQSAAELADNLEQLHARRAEVEAIELQRREAATRVFELARQRQRTRNAQLYAGIAALLLAAAIVIVLVLQQSQQAAIAHAQVLARQQQLLALQKAATEDQLYVSDMVAVAADLGNRREAAGRLLLERQRPKEGSIDRRGWEWYHARALLDSAQTTVPLSAQPLRALTLSASRREAAVVGDDGMVRILTTHDLQVEREWPVHASEILDASWSPTGVLATAHADGTIALWQASTGTKRGGWQAHTGAVNTIAWCPVNTNVLTTGGADGTMNLWNASGRNGLSFSKPGAVHAITWRDNGNELAIEWTNPARVTVGHPSVHGTAAEVMLNGPPSPLAWRPATSQIALAMDGLPLRSWSPNAPKEGFELWTWLSPGTTAVAWDLHGDQVAVGGLDGKIVLVDARQIRETRNPLHGHQGEITGLAWTKSDRLLSIGADGTLRAWNTLRNSDEIHAMQLPLPATASAWSPDHQWLAILLANDELQLWDATTWSLRWAAPLPQPVTCGEPLGASNITWHTDGTRIAVGCAGRGAAIWQASNGARTAVWAMPQVLQVDWLRNDEQLFACTNEGWFALAENGGRSREPLRSRDHALVVRLRDLGPVEVSLDQRKPRLVRLDASTADAVLATNTDNVRDVTGQLTCVRTTHDRRYLAIGTSEGAVLWLDTNDWHWVQPAIGHTGPVRDIDWAPDTTRLATIGVDGLCRVYSVPMATPTWVMTTRSKQRPSGVGWSADGRKLAVTTSGDSELTIYDSTNGWHLEGEPAAAVTSTSDEHRQQWMERLRVAPGLSDGWAGLERLLADQTSTGNDTDQRDLLQAAAHLAQKQRFEPETPWDGKATTASEEWNGEALPPAAIIAQWCVLRRWDEALKACDEAVSTFGAQPPPAWYQLVAAWSLEQLMRPDEARQRWHAAWVSLDAEAGPMRRPVALGVDASDLIELTTASQLRRKDQWQSDPQNTLASLPKTLTASDGCVFACDHLLPMASRHVRSGAGRMLPYITPEFQLPKPARQVALLLGAVCEDQHRWLGIGAGSVFFHHADGTTSCVPLVTGQNLWNWWVPNKADATERPPAKLVVWTGSNACVAQRERSLMLHRLDWAAPAGTAPIRAISFVSSGTSVAPLIVSIAVPPAALSGQ